MEINIGVKYAEEPKINCLDLTFLQNIQLLNLEQSQKKTFWNVCTFSFKTKKYEILKF